MRRLNYIWKTTEMKIVNSKFGAFLLVIFVSCISYMQPMRSFVQEVDHPVSWCVFPFLLTNHVFLCLFYFGIIYINSDIPFMQYFNMYQIIRTGRRQWFWSHIAGIFIRSFLAVLATAIFTVVSLGAEIELTNEWGKVLKTLAATGANAYGFSYDIVYEIMVAYTPIELMALTILVVTLIVTFLGMLMFLIAVIMNRTLGVVVDTLLCIMLFLVLNVDIKSKRSFAAVIPTIWAQIARIKTPNLGYYWLPPLWYMVLVLILGIIICIVLTERKIKRMELNWISEDC